MPGRKPWLQVEPPLVEVAHPIVDDPPPDTRPTWNADTIVLPKANVSGSTSVRCCAWASVTVSVLTRVSGTLADAVVVVASSTAATAGKANETARTDRRWKVRPDRGMD